MSVAMERSEKETARRQGRMAAAKLAGMAVSAEFQLFEIREVSRRYIALRDETYSDLVSVLRRIGERER